MTPAQALAAARAAAAARNSSDLTVSVASRMSEGVIATRERASTWAKRLIRSLWTPVDPYDGDQVAEFAAAAAGRLATAQKTTATAAAAGQIQLLSTMGVRVKARPTAPLDIRAAGATFTDGRVELDHSATRVRYRGQDPVDLDAADITTVEVLNRPARTVRYLESQGKTREQATAAALKRLDALVDGNMMLAQRLAESEVINAAANLDGSPIVGMRRIIHPELSRTGTCGLCIAASDRLYTVRELLPMHANCKCTSAPVTEEFDPADELNAVDLRKLYRDAGGTSRAHLKRTRYKEDEHGELGPTLAPQRKYKPRSKAAKKAAGGTSVAAEESKVEVARRQLPLFEANLAKLREQGLDEESAQVKYHKRQIARYRERLVVDQESNSVSGSSSSRTKKGMKAKSNDTQNPGSAAGGRGGEPPRRPPTGGAAAAGDAGDPRIPESVRKHILDGDSKGGGHRFTSTEPNKTLFPENWDDGTVLSAISRTLDEPYTTSDDHEHLVDPNFLNLYGFVDGVRIVARMRKADGVLDTAHPLDGDGVFRTGKKDGTTRKPLPLGSVRNVPLPRGLD